MTIKTFAKVLAFTAAAEQLSWSMGYPRLLLMSGGECTDHPEFLTLLGMVEQAGMVPMILTHGGWLTDKAMTSEVLRPGRKLLVQVTHDPRFYPGAPPARVDDPRVCYIEQLSALLPIGRGKRETQAKKGLRTLSAPGSFNLRSAVRATGSFEAGLAMIRMRAVAGKAGHCTPSISHTGEVVVGESRACMRVGTVDSTMQEITDGILRMGSCNRCGLEDNLNSAQRAAVGI